MLLVSLTVITFSWETVSLLLKKKISALHCRSSAHVCALLQGKKMNVPKFTVGKLAGIALVGGLAIGFGSVAATAGNALIGDVLGNIVGDFGGIPDSVFCCDFSNCDCSNCDFSFLGGCCGCDCSNCDFSFVGDCFDNCGDGCCDPDGICCALGSCLFDSCDNMGDICACILDCIGSLSN